MIKRQGITVSLFVLLLCNTLPVQAGFFDWFTGFFSGNSQTTEQVGDQKVPTDKVNQEPQGQPTMSWWGWFRHRFLWITKEDLEESEKRQKNVIKQQYANALEKVGLELTELDQKACGAKDAVSQAQHALSEVGDNLKENDKNHLDALQELEKKQEEAFDGLETSAKDQKKVEKAELKKLKEHMQKTIDEKKRELDELEKQLAGLRQQHEDTNTAETEQLEKMRETQRENFGVVTQNIQNITENVWGIENSAKNNAQQLILMRNALSQMNQRDNKRNKAHNNLQKSLEQLLRECSGVTQNHEYLMQLLLGLNKKFGLAFQLMVLRSQEGSVSPDQLESMQIEYKTLLGSIELMQKKREVGLNDALTIVSSRSGKSRVILDEEAIHDYVSGTLRMNRMVFPMIQPVDETPKDITPVFSRNRNSIVRNLYEPRTPFLVTGYRFDSHKENNASEQAKWALLVVCAAQCAKASDKPLAITNGDAF